MKEDLLNLKEKVDSGVNFLVTQLFFDNRLFYDFWTRLPCSTSIVP
jgi:methylenetetrahydrofolate reductase (NADPH)